MTHIMELLDRLDGASAPDREIDARLDHAVFRRGLYWGRGDDLGYTPPANIDEWSNERWAEASAVLSQSSPKYTACVAAALSLAKHLAPHGRFMFEHGHNGWGWAMVQLTVNSKRAMAEATNPALALCAALLRALSQANGPMTAQATENT